MGAYVKLGIAAILPVFLSAILYIADKKTAFGKLNKTAKQCIYGVLFGILAIVGTEWGIPLNGAQVNCRDAAVLTAGLMFGAPAGIIAGIIGGLERWIAVAWGVGSFTRVACAVSTIIAGIYAAVLRKLMFENKKPGAFISLAIGVVMEVFHLTMVFITNMQTPTRAMQVVKACTIPMVVANGVSVMLSALIISLLARERVESKPSRVRISQTIQRWLLVTVVFAFIATSFFVFKLQDTIATSQTDSLLDIAIEEVAADIRDASNDNMISLLRKIYAEMPADIKEIAKKYNVSEINYVDKYGIIVNSTSDEFVGFDMKPGDQSSEFLCLLGGTQEYVQDYGPISYDETLFRKYAGIKYRSGFIQIGYDAVHFQEDIDEQVVGITKNRHVGESGYVLIIDDGREVISAPADFSFDILSNNGEEYEIPEQNKTIEMLIGDEICYCRYRMVEGYYIISVLPKTEALQMRNIALYVNSFMEVLVFAILFALVYLLIKKVVVNQIKSVNSSLAKITGGNLDEVVDVRSSEEFASLSDDINSTVDTLKRYIDEASARIDKELEFAKSIQSSALPNVFPAFPKRSDFDIFASMNPAKEVGGDFYDFYMTGSDTLNFLIADVSGKGIPAAMFMMRAKTELKTLTESDVPLCDVFTRGNGALCEGNDAGMFVTAWQGSIDLRTGEVTYANAGHNPPLVKRAGGGFEYLRGRAGFVLAGMDGIKYKTQELSLMPGDTIYLYTDGVTEATNASCELYGEERLLSALNSREFENVREMCEFVKSDVDAFVGDAPQFDDITMVGVKYIGTPPDPEIKFEQAAIDNIPAVTEFIEAELEKLDCPMKIVTQFSIAIDEIYSNIVKYGYHNTTGPVTVRLVHRSDPERVYIKFSDEGIPYNPLVKEDPDVTLSAEERSIGGLGIYMVKKTMDDIKYKYENGENILTIMKRLG